MNLVPQFPDHLRRCVVYRLFRLRSEIRQSHHKSVPSPSTGSGAALTAFRCRQLSPKGPKFASFCPWVRAAAFDNILKPSPRQANGLPSPYTTSPTKPSSSLPANQFPPAGFGTPYFETPTSPTGYHEGTSYNVVQPAIAQRGSKARLGNFISQGL